MHEALTGLLDTADLAMAAVRDVVEDVGSVARLVNDARLRLDHPEDTIVAALAGGTGSGKSSLFNEIVGTDAAPVGEIRPTTSEPVAAVPDRMKTSFDAYLDHLGIERRVTHPRTGFCLIDLPDTDSVVVAHRHRVEEILPRIDVLVWVVDPEKYRDAALHHRYLRPLSGYARQFLFVLNQVDRLPAEDSEAIATDLRNALAEDGIESATILTTSVPADLPATGVDDLVAALQSLAERQEALYRKLVTDLGQAASELEAVIGPPVGYRDLLGPALDEALSHAVAGDREEAVERLSRFVDVVAERVGGEAGRRITGASAALPGEVSRVVGSLRQPRSFWRRPRPLDPEKVAAARRDLETILAPVTSIVTARARALAQVAELAVGAARLRSVIDR